MVKTSIPALSSGESDMTLSITVPDKAKNRPEVWGFVAASSLTVTVEAVSMASSVWGGV